MGHLLTFSTMAKILDCTSGQKKLFVAMQGSHLTTLKGQCSTVKEKYAFANQFFLDESNFRKLAHSLMAKKGNCKSC